MTVAKNASDAYDGKQYASLRATAQSFERDYPELYQDVPSRFDRRVSDTPQAKAYAVSVQYRIPEYIAGPTGKGCNLSFGFDSEYMEDTSKAFLPVNKKVADWTKFETMIANNRTSIETIGFGLICPDGAAVVQVDDVQFVPTAFPEAAPTDVARNGGFENGGSEADPWAYTGNAKIGVNTPKYGLRYAILAGGESVFQNISISSTAPKSGYNSYEVVYKYRVKSFSGAGSCALSSSVSDKAAPTATVETFDSSAVIASNTAEWATYTKTLTQSADIENIHLNVACVSGNTAEVWVDNVQFKPKTQQI